jgi:hypothetical protein
MCAQSQRSSDTMQCLHPCPPWGFCATEVTPEQAIRGMCGSKNGVHGYDGYVKDSTLEAAATTGKDPS